MLTLANARAGRATTRSSMRHLPNLRARKHTVTIPAWSISRPAQWDIPRWCCIPRPVILSVIPSRANTGLICMRMICIGIYPRWDGQTTACRIPMLYFTRDRIQPGRIQPHAVGLELLFTPPSARFRHNFQRQLAVRDNIQVIDRDILWDILLPVSSAMHAYKQRPLVDHVPTAPGEVLKHRPLVAFGVICPDIYIFLARPILTPFA